MVYSRAQAIDFDDWGVDGWRGKDMIPFLKNVSKIYAVSFRREGEGGIILFADALSVREISRHESRN